ncbi:MAG: exodeoxyribonuclease VII large subunit [candidate division Zixibacteria bacterium]|nr:exodeoxyribonuclease VII large subunit [candidate division Zixibacteria bacterium]
MHKLLDAEKIFSISELTHLVKSTLEDTFVDIWVEGEISNYTRAASGHRYFSLKDDQATLRAVMWRSTASRLQFELESGKRVRAFGSLSVYPPRGEYQLVCRQIIDAGIGPLEIAFQKIKEKLMREGLFDTDRKRDIPEYPETVGIVTSSTGAAIRDISSTIAARFPGMQMILAPVHVQGEGAKEEIAAAIELFNQRADIDVLIVGRGGGSLEDLWAFNEEVVARAIYKSRIPVVAAVGHEVDFTIADMVADYRAPTPTAAAERITDNWVQARHEFAPLVNRLTRGAYGLIEYYRERWERLYRSHALRKPADLYQTWSQRLDEITARLLRSTKQLTTDRQIALAATVGKLEALSPTAVLNRGYSITRLAGHRDVLRTTKGLKPGQEIETTLSEGRITSELTTKE